jgi:hypothetical protein
MPESNAAAKKRQQKANRALGLGDADGRMVRVKEEPKLSKCTVCSQEMKITKTNTELIAHATSKHSITLEECFPGSTAVSAELAAVAEAGKKSTGSKGRGDSSGGTTKAEKKSKSAAGLDDLLSAGLGGGKKKGKK